MSLDSESNPQERNPLTQPLRTDARDKEHRNHALNSFFTTHSQISRFEDKMKVKPASAALVGETNHPIRGIPDTALKQMTDMPREQADNQLLGHSKLYLTDDRCSMMGPDIAVCRVSAPLTSCGQFKVLPVNANVARAVPFAHRRNDKPLHLIPLYPRNHASFKQDGRIPLWV